MLKMIRISVNNTKSYTAKKFDTDSRFAMSSENAS